MTQRDCLLAIGLSTITKSDLWLEGAGCVGIVLLGTRHGWIPDLIDRNLNMRAMVTVFWVWREEDGVDF